MCPDPRPGRSPPGNVTVLIVLQSVFVSRRRATHRHGSWFDAGRARLFVEGDRVYDLNERIIPAAILDLPTSGEPDAHRSLIERSARALDIATATDLRDYFRLGPDNARVAVAALVDDGALLAATVGGSLWPAYLHRDARLPRRVEVQALLAPFDPFI